MLGLGPCFRVTVSGVSYNRAHRGTAWCVAVPCLATPHNALQLRVVHCGSAQHCMVTAHTVSGLQGEGKTAFHSPGALLSCCTPWWMKCSISFTRGCHLTICWLLAKFVCSNANLQANTWFHIKLSPPNTPYLLPVQIYMMHLTVIFPHQNCLFFGSNIIFCHSQVTNMKNWDSSVKGEKPSRFAR